MPWDWKYPDRGNVIQGVGYPDGKGTERLNNPGISNAWKPLQTWGTKGGDGVARARGQGHAQMASVVRAGAMKETQSLLVMPSEAERAGRNALGSLFQTQLMQEPGVAVCRDEPLCNAEQD